MSEGIYRSIAMLGGRAKELEELANDAHDLLVIQLSKDTEDFLLHRGKIITSEIALLRKQLGSWSSDWKSCLWLDRRNSC